MSKLSPPSVNLLRQLMSLEGPKVSLVRIKCANLSSSVFDTHNNKVTVDDGPCVICTHTHSSSSTYKNEVLAFSSTDVLCNNQLLSPIFLRRRESKSSDDGLTLTFCSVCLSTMQRLLDLKEEVEEIQSRILAVLKLSTKLEEAKGPSSVVQDEVTTPGVPDDEMISSNPQGQHTYAHACKIETVSDEDMDFTSEVESESGLLHTEIERVEDTTSPCTDDTFTLAVDDDRTSPTTSKTPSGAIRSRKARKVKVQHKSKAKPKIVSVEKGINEVYSCPKCQKKKLYNKRCYLTNHIRRCHNTSTTKTCPICNSWFKRDEVYQAHTHPDPKDTNKVTYVCQICGRVLDTRELWHDHQKRYHRNNGEKFQCHQCGKVLASEVILNVHSKTCSVSKEEHRKCRFEACGKTFLTRAERDDHERVDHQQLYSWRCYFCQHPHSLLNSLEIHLRTHTEERPFRCQKCGKDFRTAGHLKRHVAIVCGTDEREREQARRSNREQQRAFRANLLFYEFYQPEFERRRGWLNSSNFVTYVSRDLGQRRC